MRSRRWWSPVARRRWAIAAIFGIHLAWLLASPLSRERWVRWGAVLTRPSRALSERWTEWRWRRAQRVQDLARADAEVRRLRSELEVLRGEALRQAPRVVEAEEAIARGQAPGRDLSGRGAGQPADGRAERP